MNTRMFQHFVFLSLSCIFIYGCQSGPFAGNAQSKDMLAQGTSEPENESAMQKNLREKMAVERAKGRSMRRQRDTVAQNDLAANMAKLAESDPIQDYLAPAKELQTLPVSTPKLSDRQSDDATILQELNMAYEADREGNLEKAQGYYQRVLSIDPDNFGALHRLAILEDKKQNFPAAEAYYLKALKLDPDNADLLSDIGYSYMLQGRDDYGEKYLQEALKYQPGHRRSLDHLGWFYGRSGQYDRALALFRMTSGEAQAQLKFAQLFPGVDPNFTLAQGSPMQQNTQMLASENAMAGIQPVAQMQPVVTQHVQYVNAGTNPEQVNHAQNQPGMNPALQNNPTLQIAEMMKREREKAIQARENRQLPAMNPNQFPVNQVTNSPLPAAVNVQNSHQQFTSPNASAGSTPQDDSQIQAWPPAGDPGITQAVEASKYWASKEQQAQNQRLQRVNQPPVQQQRYGNRVQGTQQRPLQAVPVARPQQVPAGRPQMRRQRMVPTNVPRAGQPQFGTQYQRPGQFPNYRMNSTQAPNQHSPSANQQQVNHQKQIQEAARTGMNVGPGQMFPVAGGRQANPNDASLMSPPIPVNNVLPSSAQVADQNVYQAGGLSIRQAPQSTSQNQRVPQINQAGYVNSNQNHRQRNGIDPALQNRSVGGFQQTTSSVPPSALYSNNPAFAPANVRSTIQGVQQNSYSPGNQGGVIHGQNSINQNSNNQQMPYPTQGAAQQQASPYRFPVQQNGY